MKKKAKLIERLMPQLRAMAMRLSRREADDLLSEMYKAILLCPLTNRNGEQNSDHLFLQRAKDRARNFLRAERRRARRERTAGLKLSAPTRAYLEDAGVDVGCGGCRFTFMTLGVMRAG